MLGICPLSFQWKGSWTKSWWFKLELFHAWCRGLIGLLKLDQIILFSLTSSWSCVPVIESKWFKLKKKTILMNQWYVNNRNTLMMILLMIIMIWLKIINVLLLVPLLWNNSLASVRENYLFKLNYTLFMKLKVALWISQLTCPKCP